MSVYPLALPGWDELSTWGWDDAAQSWYAQLTPNGGDDSNGPQIWLAGVPTPYRTEVELMTAIIQSTGVQPTDALNAMRDNIGKR
jgi:hypothetical protein